MADKKQEEDILSRRIKKLQEDRVDTQKKVYTKWVNSFLIKENMEVSDLFIDFADGIKLFKLLEILSGERIGKPNRGLQKFHHMDNVNRCFNFLRRKKVALVGVSAEEIVAGNSRSILAILGRIIINHKKLTDPLDSTEEGNDEKSYKDSLLHWCKNKTASYSGVDLKDFMSSWRSGMAFNALIHSHRPDLVNYETLNPSSSADNLRNAFDVAEKSLGIPKLLDIEDVDKEKPDENSIITYIALYYQFFHEANSTKIVQPKKPVSYRTERVINIKPPLSIANHPSNGPITKPKPAFRSTVTKGQHNSASSDIRPSVDADMSIQSNAKRDVQDVGPVSFSNSWECDYCTYVNTPSTHICAMCFKAKIEHKSTPVTSEDPEENKQVPENKTDDEGMDEPDTIEEILIVGTDSEPSSLETVIENISKGTAPIELGDEIKENSTLTSDNHRKNDPLLTSPVGPVWSCPGCQHCNPETTRICSFCFRTLRQLKSLPFEELGIKDLKQNTFLQDFVQQDQDIPKENGSCLDTI